jgi:2-polyprenyl-6-methoxyphenol hydroxylase-like FAD-dependent oxidoreductase
MAQSPRAVVVGGGIGGLTAALALHRRGWRVTVLERAHSLEPVGAGISLAPNSIRALDVVGLGDEIRALAAWQGDGGLRTPSGRWLSRGSAAAVAERFGGPLVLLHRATLIDSLAARLPGGTVRTAASASLTDAGDPGDPGDPAEPGGAGRPARVGTPDGELEAELVVGADGIHSAVRRTLFPEHPGPVYSGFTTWRVVIPVPGADFASHETWGRGRIWGTHPLKDGRVYAYAAATVPAGGRAPDDERAELDRLFGDWHDPIPAVIAAARPEDVLRHDVHHIAEPLPAFHRGRVALLGDAAHAMPPTLGQGGNQAIEDAIVLAHHADPERPDLAAYTADRKPRTTAISRKAVGVARLNMMSSRPGIALRNAAVAVVSKAGPALLLRSFDGIADWRPPQRPYASDEARAGTPSSAHRYP